MNEDEIAKMVEEHNVVVTPPTQIPEQKVVANSTSCSGIPPVEYKKFSDYKLKNNSEYVKSFKLTPDMIKIIMFSIIVFTILLGFCSFFYLVWDEKFKSVYSTNITVEPADVTVPVNNVITTNVTVNPYNNFTIINKICISNSSVITCN